MFREELWCSWERQPPFQLHETLRPGKVLDPLPAPWPRRSRRPSPEVVAAWEAALAQGPGRLLPAFTKNPEGQGQKAAWGLCLSFIDPLSPLCSLRPLEALKLQGWAGQSVPGAFDCWGVVDLRLLAG